MEGAPGRRDKLPAGSELNVYVTNVHNVPDLRFFAIIENASNLRFLEAMRDATKAPMAFRCLRLPHEGTIFGLRYGCNSSALRAVRPTTVCLTKQNEILLPDLGRKEKIDEKDPRLNMFHLPMCLCEPPSIALCCQLQGINDDVTIVPDMLRAVMPGLLFHSLKLRVEGYVGTVLKVKLINISLEKLKKWQRSIEIEKKNAFDFSLEDFKMAVKRHDGSQIDKEKFDAAQILAFSSPIKNELHEKIATKNANFNGENLLSLRPILGAKFDRCCVSFKRPLIGHSPFCKTPKYSAWKQDTLAFIAIVDKRTRPFYCAENAILVITPTYVGNLERFFGVIHEPGKQYLQHMWTDADIVWESRFIHGDRPLLFNIVLAKHAVDHNWYRAKVIEVLQDKEYVRVFFVDYGGDCYVKLKNLARISKKIANMPFQATLFRLHGVYDVTSSRAEHSLAVSILRKMLLKKTMLVNIVRFESNQLFISFQENTNKHITGSLIGKGFLNAEFYGP